MPRRPAKLSNCYVPLPLPTAGGPGGDALAPGRGNARPDGRATGHELRQLCMETSVISGAMGSCLVELGHTKVLVEAHLCQAAGNGPGGRGSSSSNEATNDIGSLRCHARHAPHVGIDRVSQRSSSLLPLDGSGGNKGGPSAAPSASAGKMNQELAVRESDLSRGIAAALLPVVVLEKYPKSSVVVNATVLQDDGSCLSVAILAASMALVDARVELRDLVASCTVAVATTKGDGEEGGGDDVVYLADPTHRESSGEGERVALICLAMTPNQKEVTLWNQSGRLTSEMASHAMDLCRDGCRTMHRFMREAWVSSLSAAASDGDEEMAPSQ
ncbi:unnamed protein product [Pseudo-nitzschia multistriata]|uniref:Exoribonuclease phosphorolytic domain-containing protein n=1 Tax=Pseudo-nitzschia multistriata TaxID=183589 RepID=A0A448ZB02_9STRA|nr:unnamed protein product [Pseudo-nitzschia multistriata]